MKQLLKNLLFAFGPSGREGQIRKVIEDAIGMHVDSMQVDALGNLIAVKKGTNPNGKKIMLAAHMDQIGFVVSDADKEGFLRVHNVGGLRRSHSLNRRVVFENGMNGVLSYEVEGNDPADATMMKMFIDIGASSREEALSKVELGDMAVYAPEMFFIGADYVAGVAMDDRAGCAIQIEVMKKLKDCPNEVIFVFTTQEEVGLRGATGAAYSVAPDEAIAIDVTLTGDTPKGHKLPMKLGEGIAVKIMDQSMISSPEMVRALEAAAQRSGAKFQREVLNMGGTDAGAIHRSRGGVPSCVLSIPCRYVHSATELVSLGDMESGVTLLNDYLMQA